MKNGTETLVDVYECWETHDLDWTRLMQKKRKKKEKKIQIESTWRFERVMFYFKKIKNESSTHRI